MLRYKAELFGKIPSSFPLESRSWSNDLFQESFLPEYKWSTVG
jgi:hypothetical protein